MKNRSNFSPNKFNILIVCRENTCRSPTAALLLNEYLKSHINRIKISVSSAGERIARKDVPKTSIRAMYELCGEKMGDNLRKHIPISIDEYYATHDPQHKIELIITTNHDIAVDLSEKFKISKKN